MSRFFLFLEKCFISFSPKTLHISAKILAVLFFDVFRLRRRIVIKNLTIAFDQTYNQKKLISIGRQSYYHFLMNLFELLAGNGRLSEQVVEVEGKEHLQKILEEDQGLYFLALHMGNWEVMGSFIARHFRPSYVIVKPISWKAADDFIKYLRDKNSFLTVIREKKGDAVRRIKEILAAREGVGFAFDHARPNSDLYDFFGRPAKTNTSLAYLLKELPAPILPAYTVRLAPCLHKQVFLPPLKVIQTDNPEDDIKSNTMMFQKCVEEIIKKHPEQYFWMHNRWKS